MFPCPLDPSGRCEEVKEPEVGPHGVIPGVLLKGSRVTDREAALNTEKGHGPRKQVPLEAGRGKEQTLALQASS